MAKKNDGVATSQAPLSVPLMLPRFEFPVVARRLRKHCGHLEFLVLFFIRGTQDFC